MIKKLGLTQSLADPSLYTKTHDDGTRLLVCTIVDDFIITGNKTAVQLFKAAVAKEWEMTDEGRLFWCLNLRVTRDLSKGLLKVDQAQYVREMLVKFNMEACNPRKTPMDERPVLSSVPCPENFKGKQDSKKFEHDLGNFPYASALGSLLYLRLTRPDALVAISMLSRFLKCPLPQHWAAVKALLRYLKGSINRGLLYESSSSNLSLDDE